MDKVAMYKNMIYKQAAAPLLLEAGNQANRARKPIMDAVKKIKVNPRLAEFGIGAVPGSIAGGVYGAKKAGDDKTIKRKKIIQGALAGGALGGVGAVGLNQLGNFGLKTKQKNLNKAISQMKEQNKTLFDIFDTLPGNAAEEKIYENIYKNKQRAKEFYGNLKNGVLVRRNGKYEKVIFDPMKSSDRKAIRKLSDYGKHKASKVTQDVIDRKNDMANILANREANKSFYDNFVNLKDADFANKYRNKIFGGIRGQKEAFKETMDISRKNIDLIRGGFYVNPKNKKLVENLEPRDLTNLDLYKRLKGIKSRTPEEIKKSKEFRDNIINLRKGVNEDFKKGKMGDYFNKKFSAKDLLSRLSQDEVKNYSSLFGVDLNNVKNKSDIKSAYKKLARKFHPDINKAPGAAAKMTVLNEAMSKIENTDWFNKLASIIYK